LLEEVARSLSKRMATEVLRWIPAHRWSEKALKEITNATNSKQELNNNSQIVLGSATQALCLFLLKILGAVSLGILDGCESKGPLFVIDNIDLGEEAESDRESMGEARRGNRFASHDFEETLRLVGDVFNIVL